MAEKDREKLATEYVLPAEYINKANLQGQGRCNMGNAKIKAGSQKLLITADYLEGEEKQVRAQQKDRKVNPNQKSTEPGSV